MSARAGQGPAVAAPAAVATALVAGGTVALGIPAAGAGLAVLALLGLWWAEGSRDGRRLREALLAAVGLALTANFVSSWTGSVAGIPTGAVLRDLAVVVVIAAGVADAGADDGVAARSVAYAALAVAVLASVELAQGLPAVVGARTYLLYPALLLVPAWRMTHEQRLSVCRGVVVLVGVIAVIGIAEALTRGAALSAIGFDAGFAETARGAASPYFAGFRRATGGLGNFLEFGFVMGLGLLLARASLEGRARHLAIALFSVAAFLSWSRIAWALALVIAIVPLAPLGRPARRVTGQVVSGVLVVGLVATLAFAMGPGEVVRDRLLSEDRVTQRSNVTRTGQLSRAVESGAVTRVFGTGPGTEGAAADRQAGRANRTVSDNGYLVWLLELGLFGLVAIGALTLLLIRALVDARAWWALVVLGGLAIANAFFTAADSRVALAMSFIAIRLMWRSPEERARDADPAPGRLALPVLRRRLPAPAALAATGTPGRGSHPPVAAWPPPADADGDAASDAGAAADGPPAPVTAGSALRAYGAVLGRIARVGAAPLRRRR